MNRSDEHPSWLRSARLAKVMPLALVLLVGVVLPGEIVDAASCVVALGFVLVVSIFGTQLNIFTDVELDRGCKPQLFRSLARAPCRLRAAFFTQTLLALLILASAAYRSPGLAAALLTYGLAGVLYSYNFLAFWDPRANRLKVFWWGHALAVLTAYSALWIAGFACAGPTVAGGEPWVWATVAGATLVDYGVFLNECAADADDERAHGLQTLPALVGARGASLVGLLVASLGVVALAHAAAIFDELGDEHPAVALRFYATVQALGCFVASVLAGRPDRARFRATLIDCSFWLSRAGTLAITLTR